MNIIRGEIVGENLFYLSGGFIILILAIIVYIANMLLDKDISIDEDIEEDNYMNETLKSKGYMYGRDKSNSVR